MSNNTQSTIGLPLVENRAPAYELDTSVFSEVFNSWLRISHAPADYTQPANATEASAWAYSAATDTYLLHHEHSDVCWVRIAE